MTRKIVTSSKANLEQATTITPAFELKLPDVFNVTANYVIPISKFLEAHVFENYPDPHFNRNGNNSEPDLGYRVVFIDKRTGGRPQKFRYEDAFHRSPLDVMLQIREMAMNVAPKQRRTVEREEEY